MARAWWLLVLLGMTGCPIPFASQMNASSFYGRLGLDLYPGDTPTTWCPSDALGLGTGWNLRHRIEFTLRNGVIASEQTPGSDLIVRQTLSGDDGWWAQGAPQLTTTFLAKLVMPASGGMYWNYWFHGYAQWGGCFPGSGTPCNFLAINPNLGSAGHTYTVQTGWHVPATNQWCVTEWRYQWLECHYVGESDYTIGPDDEARCWLPPNSTWVPQGVW